jgi:multiple sugar transport system substrate-binding protein/raffinose/stachyose/melibiose transport system substrate-binding protein
MLKAAKTVADAPVFAFNYDLATTPPMAEGGLNMFAQFMDKPADYASYLEQAEGVAKDVFKK